MPALHPIMHLSPVPTGMHSSNAGSTYIPIGQSHAHAARLEGCVGGTENALPQVMEAVRRMIRPVVPVDERRAYVVEAVHLVPHGHPKYKVLLPQENEALAGRADSVPFSPGGDAFQPVVGRVVVEGGLDGTDFEGELAGSVTGEVGLLCVSHEWEGRGEAGYDALYSRLPRVKMRREEKRAPKFRRMETLSAASRPRERPRGWAARDLGDMLVVC